MSSDTAASLDITPLSDTLGADVSGIDLAGIDDDAFRAIEDALHQHLVLIVRDQDLTPAAFAAFCERFGRPQPHVIDQFHHTADPNILILSNRKADDGTPMGLADGGTYFHCDYSYLATPARCTVLHAREIPHSDAGTTFANQRAAYEALPESEKARIAGLVCQHHYGNRDNLDEASRTVASPLSDAQKDRVKWERHPLVRRHPHTGQKSLYAVSGTSFGIEGMEKDEGVALLNALKAHSTSEPFCYTPQYRVGDVVIWDNCSLLHQAPLMKSTDPRTLWRITVLESGPTMAAA